MNNKNLIFVSYYPGCCGQFIGGICDILLNNKTMPNITETGETTRNFQRYIIGLENKVNDPSSDYRSLIGKPYLNEHDQILFDKLIADWNIKYFEGQDHYVITSHILAIKELQSKFKYSKFILSIPKNQSEIDLASRLWNIKNEGKSWYVKETDSHKLFYSNIGLESLEQYKDGVLLFHLSDILNEQMIESNINRLITHLNITDDYTENAIIFYKNYLKKQKLH